MPRCTWVKAWSPPTGWSRWAHSVPTSSWSWHHTPRVVNDTKSAAWDSWTSLGKWSSAHCNAETWSHKASVPSWFPAKSPVYEQIRGTWRMSWNPATSFLLSSVELGTCVPFICPFCCIFEVLDHTCWIVKNWCQSWWCSTSLELCPWSCYFHCHAQAFGTSRGGAERGLCCLPSSTQSL